MDSTGAKLVTLAYDSSTRQVTITATSGGTFDVYVDNWTAGFTAECSFPVVIFEYVSNGLGVALTPVSAELWRGRTSPAPLEKFDVVLRDVTDLFGHEPLYYIRRRGQLESPQLATFRELVLGKPKPALSARRK